MHNSDVSSPARIRLRAAVEVAHRVMDVVADAFNDSWSKNPSLSIKAVFGWWINKSQQHLGAITILAEKDILATVAVVHYRQILEIFLQVRRICFEEEMVRDRLAQKVYVWGCVDYLEKIKREVHREFVADEYKAVSEHLRLYDPALVKEVEEERAHGTQYWFGRSIGQLATQVSRGHEDLKFVYKLLSAQLHGISDIPLNVTSPKPDVLSFQPYSDKDTLHRWATDWVDLGTQMYLNTWNEIAEVVGAPCARLR